jgi:outer membrane protein
MVNDVGGWTLVLPYVYGDYGASSPDRAPSGVKTLPLGAGHLELVARVNTEGFDADRAALRGVGDRRNPAADRRRHDAAHADRRLLRLRDL